MCLHRVRARTERARMSCVETCPAFRHPRALHTLDGHLQHRPPATLACFHPLSSQHSAHKTPPLSSAHTPAAPACFQAPHPLSSQPAARTNEAMVVTSNPPTSSSARHAVHIHGHPQHRHRSSHRWISGPMVSNHCALNQPSTQHTHSPSADTPAVPAAFNRHAHSQRGAQTQPPPAHTPQQSCLLFPTTARTQSSTPCTHDPL